MQPRAKTTLIAAGVLVASAAAGGFVVWWTMPRVTGELRVGVDDTERRLRATCESGVPRGYFGVRIHPEDEARPEIVVVDFLGERTVRIDETALPPPIVLHAADCKTFDVVVTESRSSVNHVRELEGHLVLDCGAGARAVRGTVTFAHCH